VSCKEGSENVVTIINTISPIAAPAMKSAPAMHKPTPASPRPYLDPSDTVELSGVASSPLETVETSSLSLARIHAIREQIARGVFETPERLSGTAERLLDVIG